MVTLTLLAAVRGSMGDSGTSVWYLLYFSVSGSGIDSLVTLILPAFAVGMYLAMIAVLIVISMIAFCKKDVRFEEDGI